VTTRGHRHRLVFGLVSAVIAVGIVMSGLVAWSEASTIISAGRGTATLTWVRATSGGGSVGNPPQSFRGSIDGHAVSGIATTPLSASTTSRATKSPQEIQIFRYKGTFAGEPFDLGMYIRTPFPASSFRSVTGPSFMVKGTWNRQQVHGLVGMVTNASSQSAPVSFHGTIGKWKVSGTFHAPTGNGQRQGAMATFTVS
jgi:hypothetical protein